MSRAARVRQKILLLEEYLKDNQAMPGCLRTRLEKKLRDYKAMLKISNNANTPTQQV